MGISQMKLKNTLGIVLVPLSLLLPCQSCQSAVPLKLKRLQIATSQTATAT